MASKGIFAEGDSRLFSLTPLAEPLRSDVPGSKRALALMSGDEQFRAWAEIDYSIQTGEIAFERVFSKPIFDYLGENPDKAKIFDAAMVGILRKCFLRQIFISRRSPESEFTSSAAWAIRTNARRGGHLSTD